MDFNQAQLQELTFDRDIGMRTLQGMLPTLNHMLASSRNLGILFLDLTRVRRLEDTYGWQVYDNFLKKIAEVLQEFCKNYADLDCQVVVTTRYADQFLLFFPSAQTIGLDDAKLESYEKLLRSWLQQHMQGLTSFFNLDELRFHLGFAITMEKPLVRFERNIYQGIEEAQQMALNQEERENMRLMKVLRNILRNKQIDTAFQPILDLKTNLIVGYEALSSNRSAVEFKNTELLFSLADRWGMGSDLDRVCRLRAIEQTKDWLETSKQLFLNTSPAVIDGNPLDDGQFLKKLESVRLDPARVVLELTERRAIDHFDIFTRNLNELKKEGIKIAIDDAGAGYASLNSIAELRPDFLKFDMIMVRDIDQNLIKQDLCATLLEMANKIGSVMIAEGIEREGELETVKRLGVHYGQGYLLGRPIKSFKLRRMQSGEGAWNEGTEE